MDASETIYDRLKTHIPFLIEMINKLRVDSPQHKKMIALLNMITNTERNFKTTTLLQCEDVILKLQATKNYPKSRSDDKPTASSAPLINIISDIQIIGSVDLTTEEYPSTSDHYLHETPSVYSMAADTIGNPKIVQSIVSNLDVSGPLLSIMDLQLEPMKSDDIDKEIESILNACKELQEDKLQSQVSILNASKELQEDKLQSQVSILNASKVLKKDKLKSKVSLIPTPLNIKPKTKTTVSAKKCVDKADDAKLSSAASETAHVKKVRVEKVIVESDSIFGVQLTNIDETLLTDQKEKKRRDSKNSNNKKDDGHSERSKWKDDEKHCSRHREDKKIHDKQKDRKLDEKRFDDNVRDKVKDNKVGDKTKDKKSVVKHHGQHSSSDRCKHSSERRERRSDSKSKTDEECDTRKTTKANETTENDKENSDKVVYPDGDNVDRIIDEMERNEEQQRPTTPERPLSLQPDPGDISFPNQNFPHQQPLRSNQKTHSYQMQPYPIHTTLKPSPSSRQPAYLYSKPFMPFEPLTTNSNSVANNVTSYPCSKYPQTQQDYNNYPPNSFHKKKITYEDWKKLRDPLIEANRNSHVNNMRIPLTQIEPLLAPPQNVLHSTVMPNVPFTNLEVPNIVNDTQEDHRSTHTNYFSLPKRHAIEEIRNMPYVVPKSLPITETVVISDSDSEFTSEVERKEDSIEMPTITNESLDKMSKEDNRKLTTNSNTNVIDILLKLYSASQEQKQPQESTSAAAALIDNTQDDILREINILKKKVRDDERLDMIRKRRRLKSIKLRKQKQLRNEKLRRGNKNFNNTLPIVLEATDPSGITENISEIPEKDNIKSAVEDVPGAVIPIDPKSPVSVIRGRSPRGKKTQFKRKKTKGKLMPKKRKNQLAILHDGIEKTLGDTVLPSSTIRSCTLQCKDKNDNDVGVITKCASEAMEEDNNQDKMYILPDIYYYWNMEMKKCKLCSKVSRSLVAHYQRMHPEHEVYVSRLSPKQTDDALHDAALHKIEEIDIKHIENRLFSYKCRFCEITLKTVSINKFITHMHRKHTGEYRYKCNLCRYKTNNETLCRKHLRNSHKSKSYATAISLINFVPSNPIVFGYVCSECNFLQVNENAVNEHIKIYHMEETARPYRINLSMLYVNDADKVPKTNEHVIPLTIFEQVSNQEHINVHDDIKEEQEEGMSITADLTSFLCEDLPSAEESTRGEKSFANICDMQYHTHLVNTRRTSIEHKLQDRLLIFNNPNIENNIFEPNPIQYEADQVERKAEMRMEPRTLKVSAVEATHLDGPTPLYVCKFTDCVFRTTIRNIFETHCNLTHRDFKGELECELCPDNPTVCMYDMFKHLCEHIDNNDSNTWAIVIKQEAEYLPDGSV